MGTLTTPALNLRKELAEGQGHRRSAKPELIRVPFANLVTNGDFATDLTGWDDTSAGSGTSTHSGGVLNLETTVASEFGRRRQTISVVTGRRYKWSIDLTTCRSQVGYPVNVTNGIYQTSTVFTGTDTAAFTAPDDILYVAALKVTLGTGTADNAHLWEADPSDDAPWLRLPAGYRVGDRGRVVRDGLELMDGDFTEVLTGIGDHLQAFIKPMSPPGVNTRFNVYCSKGGV